ncbi:MAG: lysophospholipid acyltransferase family protein [candidate division NC10 bacterium]|nr:lysophospholipid acyltransferase family protein [candidate division NC10 bacterium]MBI4413522.1 lysophospholipid acyltransferase family protein [candidate division NC10 bacterium]
MAGRDGKARLRERVEFLGAMALVLLVASLPEPLAFALGRLLGRLWYAVDGRHRRVALENLARAFGSRLTEAERKAIARKHFIHLGYTFVETCRLRGVGPAALERVVEVEGAEHLERARERGRGVVVVTAHFGSWEVLPRAWLLLGEGAAIVTRPLDNPLLEAWIAGIRTAGGNQIIQKRHALRHVVEALRRGGTVAMLIDQNVAREQGVFVDFFGTLACTTTAATLAARRTGAALLPAVCPRSAPGRFTVRIGKEIPVAVTGDGRRDILATTAEATAVLEGFIREHPEQWFWVHRRWKTRPEGEG